MGGSINATVTNFDDEKEVRRAGRTDAEIEADEADAPVDAPVDYVFYRQFWSLQKFFTEPQLCYRRDGWEEFLKCMKSVLHTFTCNKLEANTGASRHASEEHPTATVSEEYFPKFLTSSKLFHLQQTDSQFRRQILTQLLILFQYLTGNARKGKESQVLSAKQAETVVKMEANVYRLLKSTPPEGELYASTIQSMIQGEAHWIAWKSINCPEFFRPKVELKRKSEEMTTDADPKKAKRDLGSAELTRLWNLTDTNIAGCTTAVESGRSIPDAGEYFKEAIGQVAGDFAVDRRFWVFDDAPFCWRGLRLLGKEKLHYFQDFKDSKTLTDYMAHVMKKLADDLGGAAKAEDKSLDE